MHRIFPVVLHKNIQRVIAAAHICPPQTYRIKTIQTRRSLASQQAKLGLDLLQPTSKSQLLQRWAQVDMDLIDHHIRKSSLQNRQIEAASKKSNDHRIMR